MDELVPIIDITQWRSTDSAARAAVAAQVDDACTEVGFLQIAGHSLPAETIDGLLSAMDQFFALPAESKLALVSPAPEINRGYAPVGAESLAYSLGHDSPPDLFEAFNVGPDDIPIDDPVYAAQLDGVFAGNIWPDRAEADGFRRAVTAYFEAVRTQAHELTDIFAAALGLDDQFFQPFTTHSTDVLRLNHYLAAPTNESASDSANDSANDSGSAAPRRLGMGAHTDYGILTVLLADDVPGLEVLAPSGEWTAVRPQPGNLLINLGDLLATWSNDRWRSSLHRVLPPPPGGRRRSAAFFHDGNYDALVSCLPTCTSADNPPRYPPVTAGDHVKAKLLGPRTLSKSLATSTVGDRLSDNG